MKLPLRVSLLLIAACWLAGCKQATGDKTPVSQHTQPAAKNSRDSFPPVKPIETVPHTCFAPTLESSLDTGSNTIYTPALAYAWDLARREMHGNIRVLSGNGLLQQLNTATSWRGVLDTTDYSTEVRTANASLQIKVAFHKALDFADPFDTVHAGFTFLGQPVKAFGMPYRSAILESQVRILFYQDDDHFVVELIPKEAGQRLLIAKGFAGATLLALWQRVQQGIHEGRRRQQSEQEYWKYRFNDGDKLIIPKCVFNLSKDYTELEGEQIGYDKAGMMTLKKLGLQTAFVLDEHGAKVVSEAEFAAAPAAEPPAKDAELPKPKLLLLNKPFTIVMLKDKKANPYFMMYVANAGLLVKAKS